MAGIKAKLGNEDIRLDVVDLGTQILAVNGINGRVVDFDTTTQEIIAKEEFGDKELGIPASGPQVFESGDLRFSLTDALNDPATAQALGFEAGSIQVGVNDESPINTADTPIKISPVNMTTRQELGLAASEAAIFKDLMGIMGADASTIEKLGLEDSKVRENFALAVLKRDFQDAKRNKHGELVVLNEGKWQVVNADGLDPGDMAEVSGNMWRNILSSAGLGVTGAVIGSALGPIGAGIGFIAGASLGTFFGEKFEQRAEQDLADSLQLGTLNPALLQQDMTAELTMALAGDLIPVVGKLGVIAIKSTTAAGLKLSARAIVASMRALAGPKMPTTLKTIYAKTLALINPSLSEEGVKQSLMSTKSVIRTAKWLEREIASQTKAIRSSPIANEMERVTNNFIDTAVRETNETFGEALQKVKGQAARGDFDEVIDAEGRNIGMAFEADAFTKQLNDTLEQASSLATLDKDTRLINGIRKEITGLIEKAGKKAPTKRQPLTNIFAPQVKPATPIKVIKGEEAFEILRTARRRIGQVRNKLKEFEDGKRTLQPEVIENLRAMQDVIDDKFVNSITAKLGPDNELSRAMRFYSSTVDELDLLRNARSGSKDLSNFAKSLIDRKASNRVFKAVETIEKNINAFKGEKIINVAKLNEDLGILAGAESFVQVVPGFSNQATLLRVAAPAGIITATGALVSAPLAAAGLVFTGPAIFPRAGFRGFQKVASVARGITRAARPRGPGLAKDVAQRIAKQRIEFLKFTLTLRSLTNAGVRLHENPQEVVRVFESMETLINQEPDVQRVLMQGAAEAGNRESR